MQFQYVMNVNPRKRLLPGEWESEKIIKPIRFFGTIKKYIAFKTAVNPSKKNKNIVFST
ncbi:MAG: hypothetical protein LBB21_00415 [Holosporaceae bacterium]|nr:hypothetical protein [Holosporaceae bacterium]